MQFRAYPIACALGLLLLPGCGSPSVAPVRGRVTCNGQPVADAAIIFSPRPKNETDRESGKAAAAATDADGWFVLSTYKVGDGALVGKHRAAVTLDERIRSPCKSKVVIVEIKPGDNEILIELNK
jgi:hypothetical protein